MPTIEETESRLRQLGEERDNVLGALETLREYLENHFDIQERLIVGRHNLQRFSPSQIEQMVRGDSEQ